MSQTVASAEPHAALYMLKGRLTRALGPMTRRSQAMRSQGTQSCTEHKEHMSSVMKPVITHSRRDSSDNRMDKSIDIDASTI